MELFKLFGTIAINNNDANNSIDETTGRAQNSEPKITSAFKKIGAAVATYFAVDKIVAFGKSVVDITASFEDAMLKVQSLSGATADEYDRLSEAALQYGSTTAWTSKDVADAMGYMALAGFNTNEILASTSGMLSLASASGEELATVTDILTDSMTGFGDSAEDAGRYADVLATVQAKTNTTVGMLGEAFKYVSPLAGSYGYKLEDVSTALGQMANAGVKGSMAGTSLSSIITRLGTDTDGCRETIEKMGIAFYNQDGTARNLSDVLTDLCDKTNNMTVAEKSALAKQIAGQEAQKGLLAILNQGSAAYKDLNAQIRAVGESTESEAQNMAENMESGLGGAIRNIQSAFEGFKIAIGQKFSEPLGNAIRKAADWINATMVPALDRIEEIAGDVGEFWREVLEPAIMGVWNAFGAIVDALKPVFDVFSSLSPITDESKTAFDYFRDACFALETALEWLADKLQLVAEWFLQHQDVFIQFAGLIQSVVMDIVEIVKVIFEYIQTYWQAIGVPVWEAIKYAIDLVAQAFAERMPEIEEFFGTAVADIKDAWENHLKPALVAIGEFLDKVLKPAFETVFKGIILPIVDFVFKQIKSAWENVLKPIFIGICDFLTGVFTGNWKLAFEGLWNIVKGILNSIIGGFENMVNAAIAAVNTLLDGISAVASAVGSLIGLEPVSLGIDYIKLPRLAKGGILEQGEVGLLEGDGAEAVVPLEKNREWIARVSEEMQVQGIGGNKETLDVLQKMLDALNDLKESNAELPDTLTDAISGLKFSINNREFARLVKAV